MTASRKENNKKMVIGVIALVVLGGLFLYKYISYTSVVIQREEEINGLNKSLLKKEGDIASLKVNIENLKKKIDEEKRKGLDIEVVKKDIEEMLRKIEIVNIRLIDIGFHKNYNNLLDVNLQIVSKGNDDAAKMVDIFAAKKILKMKSVQRFLNLYGDYQFIGDSVRFQYLE